MNILIKFEFPFDVAWCVCKKCCLEMFSVSKRAIDSSIEDWLLRFAEISNDDGNVTFRWRWQLNADPIKRKKESGGKSHYRRHSMCFHPPWRKSVERRCHRQNRHLCHASEAIKLIEINNILWWMRLKKSKVDKNWHKNVDAKRRNRKRTALSNFIVG